MSIVHVRQVILEGGKRSFEVGKGVSPYTPCTTHYNIDDTHWTLPLTTNAIKGILIHCKVKGIIPPHASLPDPPIKRKL